MSTLPAALQRLLTIQHNVATAAQIKESGLPRSRLQWLLESGQWSRVAHGIYYTGRGTPPWLSHAWAASLAGGADAVIGREAAAHLHGLTPDEPDEITVFVPSDQKTVIRPHMSLIRSRIRRNTQTIDGLLCTTASETILDCAETLTGNALEALISKAFQQRRSSRSALRKSIAGRRTIAQRDLLLAAAADADQGAHSAQEIRYLRTVERAHGLVGVTRQVRVGPAREWVDIWYPEYGVIVELDGRAFHEDSAFRDRRRDNRNARADLRVLRYGWADLIGNPCAIALEVAALLIDRGWDPTQLDSCGGLCLI